MVRKTFFHKGIENLKTIILHYMVKRGLSNLNGQFLKFYRLTKFCLGCRKTECHPALGIDVLSLIFANKFSNHLNCNVKDES